MLALLVLLQAPTQVPEIGTSTELVHVDVLVSDKRGRPVTGLSRGDFSVFESGRPAEIAAFLPPDPAPSHSTPSLPAAEAPGGTPRAGAARVPTIVVYVDNRNLTRAGRRRILEGLDGFLADRIAAGARVLVLAESAGTRALSDVTADPVAVRRALEGARGVQPQGDLRDSDERTALDLVKAIREFSGCRDGLHQMLAVVRSYAQGRVFHHRETMAQLAGVSAAVGTLPGSKILLFLTENLQQRPGLGLFHQLGDICPEVMNDRSSEVLGAAQEFDLARGLRDVAARANSARLTVYPVDGAGLRPPSASDVSRADRLYVPSASNDGVRRANRQAGPSILAEETGGVAVFDANRVADRLGSLEADLHGRYVLGVRPNSPPDGRSHSLEVEVARKGLRVRHRLSYLHSPPGEILVTRTWAALLLGYQEDALGLRVTAEESGGEEGAALAIRISLPPDRLGSRVDGVDRVGEVRIVMATRGSSGGATEGGVDARQKTVKVRWPVAQAGSPGTGRREIVVEMPFGAEDREIAVGVRDLIGGGASYARLVVGMRRPDAGRDR